MGFFVDLDWFSDDNAVSGTLKLMILQFSKEFYNAGSQKTAKNSDAPRRINYFCYTFSYHNYSGCCLLHTVRQKQNKGYCVAIINE